ncbi:MAG: dicarboxylate/amino acid:cation symporter [Holosporales bacterium]|nr:dicarboxylate/amino acid:cation symporter [Holosporales bacterium]
MRFKKFLNLPFFIFILFLLILFFGNYINTSMKSQLYSVSILLKDIIICTLPFLIFSFVWSGILHLKGESLRGVFILIPLVCLSNFFGFWVSYIFAVPILHSDWMAISALNTKTALSPAWELPISHFVSNDLALGCGFLLGIIGNLSKTMSGACDKVASVFFRIANFILKRIICNILPLFILGFVIKMQHEDSLAMVIKDYSKLLFLVAILAYGYIFTGIFILTGRNFATAIEKFKNLLPSILIGFFGMSSTAAIPSTIEGCKKNLKNIHISNFVVPSSANMHLLGDCFALPIIGLAIMVSFGYELPSVQDFFIFSIYGVAAKFAAAGIPGGSAIIFAPLFESIFDFSGPMVTAVTAIYILFDPVATSANVFGHGMFAILFEKVSDWLGRIIPKTDRYRRRP